MAISSNVTFIQHPWGPELMRVGDPIGGTWEAYKETTGDGTGGTITMRMLMATGATGQPYSRDYYSLNSIQVAHDDSANAQTVSIKPWSGTWEALYAAATSLLTEAPQSLEIPLAAGQLRPRPENHPALSLPWYLGRGITTSGTGVIDVVWSTNTNSKHYAVKLTGFYWLWIPARWLYQNSLA